MISKISIDSSFDIFTIDRISALWTEGDIAIILNVILKENIKNNQILFKVYYLRAIYDIYI
tara:strand:- start:1325 stop:1507 length:183 start_codon:yes stop_codon:yes gene_type:complete